jgi:hypothetical protein
MSIRAIPVRGQGGQYRTTQPMWCLIVKSRTVKKRA